MKVYAVEINGAIHVHTPECKDLKTRTYHRSDGYVEDVDSKKELVHSWYPPSDFEYDADTEWKGFADFKIFPCVGVIPDESYSIEEVKQVVEVQEEKGMVFEDLAPEIKKTNYPLGKNQKVVLDYMGDNMEYFKGTGWVWYYHSSTVEVLESLERRGLVERYTHRDSGIEIWTITEAGIAVYESLSEEEREIA